ncbi:MAG: PD-(D/E)XK nuclease family protein [Gemmatimonadota bacterium]
MAALRPFDRPFPEFGYSESRWTAFQRCPRAYFLRVYQAWQGWAAPAGTASALAYRLKRTTTMPALLGTVLHDAATTAVDAVLREGRPPALDVMMTTARDSLNAVWQAARGAHTSYLVNARCPRGTMLEEFLYGDEPTGPSLARYRDRLAFLMDTLWRCDALWEEVRSAGSAHVFVPPPFGAITWRDPRLTVGSVTLFAAPDLVTRNPSHIVITDLKTGRGDGVVDQLLTYATALADGLLPNVTATMPMSGQVVALGDGADSVTRCGFDADDLAAARTRLVENINVLSARQLDPDANVPQPMVTFRMRTDVRDCARCAFRGLCHPQLYPLAVRQTPSGGKAA